ncbi:Dual specificity mitogen-activated protein kinase kinase 6-like [Oopsacas minuta]|uniref:mitogen-activated protein kinase kinase n=1 Tax=Oopsacas minuta TaxID=111878 RepID=A0AAV7K0J0_9METZ|nr:Dual specificity mitogen-activated protein kinase kinase 6-like [Oopsacas minuta]
MVDTNKPKDISEQPEVAKADPVLSVEESPVSPMQTSSTNTDKPPRKKREPMPPLKILSSTSTDPKPTPNIDEIDIEGNFMFGKSQYAKVSYEDLEQLDVIGQGQFATVYKMRSISTGHIIAIKKMQLSVDHPHQTTSSALEDAKVLRQTQSCPYIINFYGTFLHEGQIYLGEELMDSSLDKVLKVVYTNKETFSEGALKKIAFSVISALDFLLKINYMHRDIKPSNILINTKGEIKLCDMGIAGYLVENHANTKVGTTAYLAPERIISTGQYTYVSDLWAFGVTMYELATGVQPYMKRDKMSIFEIIIAITKSPPPNPPSDRSPEFGEVVKSCLSLDCDSRPSYEALLKHPFLCDALTDPFDMGAWFSGMKM